MKKMRLVLFVVLCVVWQVHAESLPTDDHPTKKRHSVSDYFYPYFDLSVGGMYSSSYYKQKSKYDYYYDRKKDEMVYDKNLYHDIDSFEGIGLDLDFKAGLVVFRGSLPFTLAPFLNVAVTHVYGTEEYKYYSRDKEWRNRDGARTSISALLGLMLYPFKSENSLFHGLFASVSFGASELPFDDSADEVYYSDRESLIKFELGNVWSVSEHYCVGFVGKAILGFALDDSSYDYPVNSKSFGLAVKIVRK